MGSNPKGFISVEEAAEILGCSTERVGRLAEHGMMKHRQSGKDLLVDGEDVRAVARLGISDELPAAELIHELRMLKAKVARLETSINMLFQVNEMAASSMTDVDIDNLVQLHRVVEADLASEEWPTDRLLSYCEVLIKLSEEDIDRLNRVLETDHSWEPFYRMLINVSSYTANHPDLSTNLGLQRVRELLTTARSNLRSIALFFVHISNNYSPSRDLLAELASNDIDMFDDLARQMKATNSKGRLTPL